MTLSQASSLRLGYYEIYGLIISREAEVDFVPDFEAVNSDYRILIELDQIRRLGNYITPLWTK